MAAIIFTITSEGLTASLDAANTGLGLQLTHVSGHDAAGVEIGQWPLSGGIVEPNSNTLRFSSVMTSTSRKELYGLKLLADSLVFATSVGASPLVVVDANIDFAPAFGLALGQIPVGSITVSTDPNAPLAIILMLQHVGSAHPHSQYTLKAAFDSHVIQNGLEHGNILSLLNNLVSRFQAMLEFQYAIGRFYWTDQVGNPNTWLQPIIGYETFWRPIVGRSLMSIDPDDLRIDVVGGVFGTMVTTLGIHNLPPHDHADGDYNRLLLVNGGQTTDTTDATGGEPNLGSAGTLQSVGASVPFNNVHPVYLSYCWQRYDPAATQPTVLSLDITDNLVAIDLHDYFVSRVGAEPIAGSDITFILNASNHIVGEVGGLVKSSAIYTGVWPAAVTLTFINNGLVAGGGGTGAYSLEGLGGERVLATSGGVAFTNVRTPSVIPEQSYQESNTPLHIINNGTIARGGGGGGLGAQEGAGGGGAPFGWAGFLGYENTATLTTGGSSGGGGAGGNLAMAGANGSSGDAFAIGAPAGGLAIDSTGPAAITITDNGIILNGVGA